MTGLAVEKCVCTAHSRGDSLDTPKIVVTPEMQDFVRRTNVLTPGMCNALFVGYDSSVLTRKNWPRVSPLDGHGARPCSL